MNKIDHTVRDHLCKASYVEEIKQKRITIKNRYLWGTERIGWMKWGRSETHNLLFCIFGIQTILCFI